MCEVISLVEYKKRIEERKLEQDLVSLKSEIDSLLEEIEEEDLFQPYMSSDGDINALLGSALGPGNLDPAEDALLTAYFTLLYDGRSDLADLVMEILKMK